MEQWVNYFIATCGASAALTGLIFVSVSLNLQKILALKQLPGRALGSLVLLTNILVISSFCLIPRQPISYLGCEIIVLDAIVWAVLTRTDIMTLKHAPHEYQLHCIQNLIFTQLAVIPYIVAGTCLFCMPDVGLYWLVPGITISFIKSLLDAWVLLVEINR